jgi:hypothetical protein
MPRPRPHLAYPPKHLWAHRLQRQTNDCILWIGHLSKRPAAADPCITYRGQRIDVARMLWALTRGGATPRSILRQCDTPYCVNPAHHRERADIKQCKRGHPQTSENVTRGTDQNYCAPCRRYRQAQPAQRARQRVNQQRRNPASQRAARLRFEEKRRLARLIDADVASWSPSLNRFMINEGHRWIPASEDLAVTHVGKHLVDIGAVPDNPKWGKDRRDDERIAQTRDLLNRIKRLRPAQAEEAA